MHGNGDLDPVGESASGFCGELVDEPVGEDDLVAALQVCALEQGEEVFVACGQLPGGAFPRASRISGGEAETAVGHQLQERNDGATAVPGPEPTVVVAPGRTSERMGRETDQRLGSTFGLLGDGFRDTHPAVDGRVDGEGDGRCGAQRGHLAEDRSR